MNGFLIRSVLLITSFFGISAHSQTVTVSGQFIDENGFPVSFLEVAIFKGDSLVVEDMTTEEGIFSFDLEKIKYKLIASDVGEKVFEKEIDIIKPINLGIITINSGIKLNEVVITGKSKKLIERKVDRLVFNVEDNIVANSNDLLTVLQVVPGIRVSGDNIGILGKSQLGVLVNDRIVNLSGEDLINYLRTINPEDISKIEIITNPPAKYEAEGNSGLINIILKKAKKNSYTGTIRGSYIQSSYPAHSMGGSFQIEKDRLSVVANLNSQKGAFGVDEKSSIFYTDQTWNSVTDRKDLSEFINGKIGLDYQLTSKSSIGIQYQGVYSTPDISDNNVINILGANNVVDSIIISEGYNKREIKSQSLNTHFITKLDSLGKQISLDLDYFKYSSSQDRDFYSENFLSHFLPTGTYMSALNKSNQDINIYSGKIDVELPVNWANISFGGKISRIDNESNVKYFDTSSHIPIIDEGQSDDFEYVENTQSLYFSISKSFGSKWEAKAGLRMENTQTKGVSKRLDQTNDFSYTEFFPTGYLSYKMNDNNSFSLSYGRRINRPAYWELNPFRWYINSVSYAEGNPFLQPSFTDNYELTYNYKDIYSTSFFISHIKDGFGQIILLDPSNEGQIFVRRNYYDITDIGLSQSVNFKPFRFWNSYNQVYSYYAKSNIDPDLNLSEFDGLSVYSSTYNTFELNRKKTITAQIHYWYQFPAKTRNREVENYSSLNIGMSFFMLDKKLALSLTAFDIFKTNNPDITTYSNGIRTVSSVYNDERRFILSLSYKFGSNNLKTRDRNFGNEEEKKRTN